MPGTGIAAERLLSFVERIEDMRYRTDKAAARADIACIEREAKAMGFDVAVMRIVIRRRRMDSIDRKQQDELVELYERALGDR